jgi:hypothetical protein
MAAPPFVFSPESGEVFSISQIAIVIIALILMALSITAYRNTRLGRIKYAIAAFALFAVQQVINFIDAQVTDIMPDDIRFALFSVITLIIVVLFFFAIVKK